VKREIQGTINVADAIEELRETIVDKEETTSEIYARIAKTTEEMRAKLDRETDQEPLVQAINNVAIAIEHVADSTHLLAFNTALHKGIKPELVKEMMDLMKRVWARETSHSEESGKFER
jgi:hypothetical protein